MRYLYLHGFASGVESGKAQFLRRRFADVGVQLEVPDLVQGDFENLTVTGQLAVIERTLAGEPAFLIGSSMGGYLAALYASLHPEIHRLVLLAPAFGFPRRWPEKLGAEKVEEWRRTGSMEVFHYGENAPRRIRWKIIEDARNWPDEPAFAQPALVFHGSGDEVVPLGLSKAYASNRPNVTLRVLESDHQLTDSVDAIWKETQAFLLG